MGNPKPHDAATEPIDERGTFAPRTPSPTSSPVKIGGQWKPMLESDCLFEPEMFLRVMHNLIKNPNIMSTHLFRADILYDSEKDHTIIEGPGEHDFSGFTVHLKQDCRPIYMDVPGYQWRRTYVRQLVPRNRQLDKDLIQSCHFYAHQEGSKTRNLVLYVPHIQDPDSMPWYHPKLRMLAFYHEWTAGPSSETGSSQVSGTGLVSVQYCLFPDLPIDQRLERTALQLLAKIHKHARGQQAGYVKRVHHDRILPQQRFQDRYARLKAKYAKSLMSNWVEETDPTKHIFEDLGIAAFLIELWSDMYDCKNAEPNEIDKSTERSTKPPFPGFVDIGCGNGLLVNLLMLEGYMGWGFDARRRKTWKTFTPEIRERVKEMVLVPQVLRQSTALTDHDAITESVAQLNSDMIASRSFHNGVFEKGTFIVSNHADELTPWTPLLAYLNDSPFIAIPCCSHNLAGAKFRAPVSRPTQHKDRLEDVYPSATEHNATDKMRSTQAAETGSLKRPATSGKNMPSAYASLCDYVSDLARQVGIGAEKEILRIPSTRNICILGRKRDGQDLSFVMPGDGVVVETDVDEKTEHIQAILSRELHAPLDDICKDWIKRAHQIAGKKGDGH